MRRELLAGAILAVTDEAQAMKERLLWSRTKGSAPAAWRRAGELLHEHGDAARRVLREQGGDERVDGLLWLAGIPSGEQLELELGT